MQTIDQILSQVDALPPAPQVLPKLLRALDNPDGDLTEVVDLIAYDPGLTAKVLQLCNSAWMGSSTAVIDISDAITRLGVRTIYRLVAGASGRRALSPTRPVAGLDPARMWKHCVTAALAAQLMAKDGGDDESGMFTAALLHEAGKIVLASAYKDHYESLLTAAVSNQAEALAYEEKSRFSIDHAEAGGRLLAKWNFPAPMIAGVSHYVRPGAAGDWTRWAAYVCLADVLAGMLDENVATPPALDGAGKQALSILGLPPDAVTLYRDRTLENFEFVNALCRL
jgi:HD-like signal output (HDOD) protein